MGDVAQRLADIVGTDNMASGDAVGDDYTGDEALVGERIKPRYVVKPATADEVAAILRLATEERVPVTARGSGTGLSGAVRPHPDGMVVSFERMNAVLEIDTDNHVAVVQPGVTLSELDEADRGASASATPVYPGEMSASVGGNVGTNAGGMRAVKYGVTRHNVLGLRGRARHRRGHPHRRQDREDLDRLRPHPADHRLRGHARARHRGHRQAAPAPRPQRDGARPVPDARRR